jgi:hypothetical protein
MKKKIYCPNCQKAYMPNDQVVLNQLHTILITASEMYHQ